MDTEPARYRKWIGLWRQKDINMKRQFQNIMENLKWAAGLSQSTFSTVLSNSMQCNNQMFNDWYKKTTGKSQVYSGGRDWPEVVSICFTQITTKD